MAGWWSPNNMLCGFKNFLFSISCMGMSSSQLTKSYFSEGLKPPTSKEWGPLQTSHPFPPIWESINHPPKEFLNPWFSNEKRAHGWYLFPSSTYPPVNWHSYGKSPFSMGKSTISMVIFNSYFDITRGYLGLWFCGLATCTRHSQAQERGWTAVYSLVASWLRHWNLEAAGMATPKWIPWTFAG